MEQVDKVKTALTEAFAAETNNRHPVFSHKEVMKMALEKVGKHDITGTWSEDVQKQDLNGKPKFTGSATWRVGDQEWSSCGETESNKAEAMRSAWRKLYLQVEAAVEEAEQSEHKQVPVRVELNRVLSPAAVSWWFMPYIFFSCESFAGDAQTSEYIVASDTQSNGNGEENPRSVTPANMEDNAAFTRVEDESPQKGAMVFFDGTFIKLTPEYYD